MELNIHHEDVGGLFAERNLHRLYCVIRFGKAYEGALSSETTRLRQLYDSNARQNTQEITIDKPVLVWHPDDLGGKTIIITDQELWLVMRYYAYPHLHRYERMDPVKIEWQNLYQVEGGEQDIIALIKSFGRFDQSTPNVEQIVREKGLKRLNLHASGNDCTEDRNHGVPSTRDSNISTDGDLSQSLQKGIENTPLPQQQENVPTKETTGVPGTGILSCPELSELIVSDEIATLLPQLTEEQFGLLKQDLLESGEAINPIVVWQEKNIIIDGHNRIRAIKEIRKENDFDVKYKLRFVNFGNMADATIWVLRNQLVY